MGEVFALSLEALCRRFDEADARAIRKQLEINAEETDLLKYQHEEDVKALEGKIRVIEDIQAGRDPYNDPRRD